MLRRVSYANVVATVALFVALGGSSYAAVALPARSVGQRALAANAVTPSKLAFSLGAATSSHATTLTSAFCAPGASCGAPVPSVLTKVDVDLAHASRVLVLGNVQASGSVNAQAEVDGEPSAALGPASTSVAPQASVALAYQRELTLPSGKHDIELMGTAAGGSGSVSIDPATLTVVALPKLEN